MGNCKRLLFQISESDTEFSTRVQLADSADRRETLADRRLTRTGIEYPELLALADQQGPNEPDATNRSNETT
jgi:hypothetical protein